MNELIMVQKVFCHRQLGFIDSYLNNQMKHFSDLIVDLIIRFVIVTVQHPEFVHEGVNGVVVEEN